MADIHNEHKDTDIVDNFKDAKAVPNATISVDKRSSDGKLNDNEEEKKNQKSVRFLNATPKEDIQQECTSLTGIDKHSHTSGTEATFSKRNPKRRSIQVQIPVHFKTGSQGNISFNEAGLCVDKRTIENEDQPINVGLLKTPVHRKGKNVMEGEATDINSSCIIDSSQQGILNMTTPMALKDISNRAQRELAMLYSPCVEEDDCSSLIESAEEQNTICKQLF